MRTVALAAVLVCGVSASVARGAYILTPLSGGSSSQTIYGSGTFALNMGLTSTGSDTSNSIIFKVGFSSPGLQYNGYTWGGAYAGGGFDASQPSSASLPTVITDQSYGSAGSAVDVYFDKFTGGPVFGTGTVVTLNLEVLSGFPTPTPVTISALPDTTSNLQGDVTTTAGDPFVLNVQPVPEPGVLMLGVMGGMGLLLRRGSRVGG